jgi:hypothetical protein
MATYEIDNWSIVPVNKKYMSLVGYVDGVRTVSRYLYGIRGRDLVTIDGDIYKLGSRDPSYWAVSIAVRRLSNYYLLHDMHIL